jgi:hypothetical protein
MGLQIASTGRSRDAWALINVLLPCPKFLSGLVFDVFVLPNMVYLSNNASHEQLLREEAHEDAADQNEEFLETSQVTQECQDICDLSLVLVEEFVCTNVNSNNIAFIVDVIVLIRLDISHLVKVNLLALSKLQDIVLKAGDLILNEKVGLFGHRRVELEEELIVDESPNRALKVISGEICVDERKIEHFVPEVIIDFSR